MSWRVAEAKQHFSEVIKATADEPQLIYNRNRLVAAVVNADLFKAFEAWRDQQQRSTLADAFSELQQLCQDEAYTLEIPARQNRENAFIKVLDDVSM